MLPPPRGGLLLLSLLLAACAATLPDRDAPVLARDVVLTLPAPAALGRTVEAAQMVTVRHGGEVFAFQGQISVTPDRFLLVGIDLAGRRALTVAWDGRSVGAETAPWLPDSVHPGAMLADLVVLYWPEAAVRAGLPPGARLDATPTGRTVTVNGRPVLQAELAGDPWNGRSRYRNLAWGYEIDVESVELGK